MKLRWHSPLLHPLRPRWRALGPAALAGLLMLAAAAALALVATPAWEAQARAEQQRQRSESLAAATAHQARQAAADTPWPRATERDARIATLIETALRHGLTAGSIEQQTRQEAGSRVAWVLVVMPVRGSYAAALQADPALALESLRLRRAGAEAGPVDADLSWAFAQAADPGPRP
jgi:Flp pilus assembly protein TadB